MRYVDPFKRSYIRERAHTVRVVAMAVAGCFLVIAVAGIAVGAIGLAVKIWSW